MQNATTVQLQEVANAGSEQLASMSDVELLVYVRRFSLSTKDPTDIAHDHRRFLPRPELERLVRLIQRMQSR